MPLPKTLVPAALLLSVGIAHAAPADTPYFTAQMDAKVESLVAQMTLEEKIKFCQGDIEDKAPRLRGSAALERLGIAPMVFYNGPRTYQMGAATTFPVPAGQGATWNPDLVRRLAGVIAMESLAGKTDCLEAPQMNIIRDPLAGRNFESFTEDPFLNGKLTAAFVQGAQNAGAPATVKGLICYNQELNRNKVNSIVSERALREIYYPGFKAGIDAGVMGIMTSPSHVNGVPASSSADVIGTFKNEFGFKGFILTDWNGVEQTVEAANAGTDLSMPGSPKGRFSAPLLMAAVKSGQVSEAVITDKVRRLLRAVYFASLIEGAPPQAKGEAPNAEHYKVALEAAQQSMVLLKNEGDILPLAPGKKIALLGSHVDKRFPGGGSSGGRMIYEITAREGIEKRWGKAKAKANVNAVPLDVGDVYEVLDKAFVKTAAGKPGFDAVYTGKTPNTEKDSQLKVTDPAVDFNWEMASPNREVIDSDGFNGRWRGVLTPPVSGKYSFRVNSSGGAWVTINGQQIISKSRTIRQREASIELVAGQSVPIDVRFNKSTRQGADANIRLEWVRPDFATRFAAKLKDSIEAAKAAETAVVCIGLDHSYDTEGSDRNDIFLPGYQVEFIKEIKRANPRTIVVMYAGSPIDMRDWIGDVPALVLPWHPGIENGNALASILSGDVNPSGKLPITFPQKYEDSPAAPSRQKPDKAETIVHHEGIFVGYRWYDDRKIAPQFPFGYGLSYTKFDYAWGSPEPLTYQRGGAPIKMSVAVKNSGTRAGAEVVQLYVRQPNATVERAMQELKGFERVELAPGETKTVTFTLDDSSFAYWDEKARAWKVDAGGYELRVGSSSRDIRGLNTVAVR